MSLSMAVDWPSQQCPKSMAMSTAKNGIAQHQVPQALRLFVHQLHLLSQPSCDNASPEWHVQRWQPQTSEAQGQQHYASPETSETGRVHGTNTLRYHESLPW
jgi:hypothetical protein